MFSHPHILSLLAHFVLKAYVAMSRKGKSSTLPLIVSAPKNIDGGTCIVLGIPPLCENSPKKYENNCQFHIPLVKIVSLLQLLWKGF